MSVVFMTYIITFSNDAEYFVIESQIMKRIAVFIATFISVNSLLAHPGHGMYESDLFHFMLSFHHWGSSVLGIIGAVLLLSALRRTERTQIS